MAALASRSITQLLVSKIRIPAGRRAIDPAHVANLAVSFEEIGQRHAIGVRPIPDTDPERATYTYELVSGAHRLSTAALLGWRVIDGVIENESALDSTIAQADENLLHRPNDALERAQAVNARLEAWAAKHPERVSVDEGGALRVRRGRPAKLPHGAAVSGKMGHGDPFNACGMGFAEETAKAAGLSLPTIKRDLAVYRGLSASLQDRLLGTEIAANPGLLRQLADMADKDEQAKVADVLLTGRTKNLSEAMAIAAGNEPVKPVQTPADEAVKAFRKLWGAASPSAREAILADMAGRALPKGWMVEQRS
ncbi:MAG: ParB/RepB/Spo0J family partition protein [Pseudomonadota bacterium]